MKDILGFFRSAIVERYCEIGARENFDVLLPLVLAQFYTLSESRLDADCTVKLHFELSHWPTVDSLMSAMRISSRSRNCNLYKLRHGSHIRSLNEIHDAEESFQVINLATSLHKLRTAAYTIDSNGLTDQRDSIELHHGHHFLGLAFQEEPDSNSVFLYASNYLLVSID